MCTKLPVNCLGFFFVLAFCSGASGQVSADVESLKQQVAQLTAALEKLRIENELLTEKLDALAQPRKKEKDRKASPTLSDRLTVGLALEGDYRSSQSAGIGRFYLTVDKREDQRITCTGRLRFNDTDLGEGRWEGIIRGNRLTLVRVGSGKKVEIEFLLKGNALEGRFGDAQGNGGTVGLLLP